MHMMEKWKLKDNLECDCENDRQTIRRIIDDCSSRKFATGINGIEAATKEAIECVKTI